MTARIQNKKSIISWILDSRFWESSDFWESIISHHAQVGLLTPAQKHVVPTLWRWSSKINHAHNKRQRPCLFQLMADFEGSILRNSEVRWLPEFRIKNPQSTEFLILDSGSQLIFGFPEIGPSKSARSWNKRAKCGYRWWETESQCFARSDPSIKQFL